MERRCLRMGGFREMGRELDILGAIAAVYGSTVEIE